MSKEPTFREKVESLIWEQYQASIPDTREIAEVISKLALKEALRACGKDDGKWEEGMTDAHPENNYILGYNTAKREIRQNIKKAFSSDGSNKGTKKRA